MDNQLRLSQIHVNRFKGVHNASFDVEDINVFIGANNSGKSSLAQMIHFGIGILQSIELTNRWGSKNKITVSLSPSQLHYSPCTDLYALGAGGRLIENEKSAIEFTIVLVNGEKVSISIRKGRNGNILVDVDNVGVARKLADLGNPYTIYSPGLAGISKLESYVSDGVLLRTIARGDANLVLRNMLYRLSTIEGSNLWDDFLEDLKKLFGEVQIRVDYNSGIDEHILVYLKSESADVPVELAGTGILQAIQILGYVHYFHPSVIILDEPDSHLHPNNQRLLCKLLQGVAQDRGTQVFLTTHSRHVVDALSGQSSFIWVRKGTVEKMNQDHEIAVLLDIGALDVKEMLSGSHAKFIVLTEDELKRGLEVLLDSSGFKLEDTLVLAYYGCTALHNLRPLLDLIKASNTRSKIIVHRDRDYLNEAESKKWETEIRNLKAEPFLTKGVDVESYYLNCQHLSKINQESEEDISQILNLYGIYSPKLCFVKDKSVIIEHIYS
ncbi:hypothetical protein EST62_08595 [Chlorobaculum sp. 24CR]|uniref:AAA family ATPase n=1 Tax=Chlorobaculum sp. 24CR TaxID=2508878 RepID=UPI00100B0379|nr:ATP-binding protein [Chlorobaculum sp. 24CR]RXK84826.1 hypothetical protein EST62_08595 [Chlorobaculum sp. 24CR]